VEERKLIIGRVIIDRGKPKYLEKNMYLCQFFYHTSHIRKFRWIGHTLRKKDGAIPKAALLWNTQGNRKRGRPRSSWRRSVIKEVSRSWNELRFLAADRQKWKGLTDNLCS
jgi:hypothetical protein